MLNEEVLIENMEDFFKKGTMLSSLAQPVGWRPDSTLSIPPIDTYNSLAAQPDWTGTHHEDQNTYGSKQGEMAKNTDP